MTTQQQVEQVKRSAVRTGLILLNDKSMSPVDRRLFAQRTIEAAAQRIELIEKQK